MNNLNLLLSMKNIIVKYNISRTNGRTINKINLNKKFMNNHIIINKKDGKTIHYNNCKVYIINNIYKILQYDYDIPVNIVKYNIKDIKSIEIGE